MIKIDKGNEPTEWTAYRLTPDAHYKAIPELRDALLAEQGYICAYCMRRIPCHDNNSNEESRIEHLRCRERYPDLEFAYRNMVVCCPGAINDMFHCDKKKGNDDISFSPFDQNFVDSLSYKYKTGEIVSANEQWNNELNNILGLNNSLLKANRKEVINGVLDVFKTMASKAKARQILTKWENKDAEGKKKAYCGIVIWYLKKWLNRH